MTINKCRMCSLGRTHKFYIGSTKGTHCVPYLEHILCLSTANLPVYLGAMNFEKPRLTGMLSLLVDSIHTQNLLL